MSMTAAERHFSFSAIERYLKCSEFYRKWMDKSIPRPVTDNINTVAGNVVHEVCELFYGPDLDRQVPVLDLLDTTWSATLHNANIGDLHAMLNHVASDLLTLTERTKATYTGADRIWDGSKPYSKPAQTSAWKAARQQLKLDQRQATIDTHAAHADPLWGKVSLSGAYALSYQYLSGFVDTLTPVGLSVCAIELPLSGGRKGSRKDTGERVNVVRLPSNDIFMGYIDLVAMDRSGYLYLLDHKTSKKAPSQADVAHWEQLLLYAWAHHYVWGRWPDFIGINHIQSGKLITAPLRTDLAEQAVRRFVAAIEAIDRGTFLVQSPTAFNSKCYDGYNRVPCEYMHLCHPTYYRQVVGPLPEGV